MRIVAISDTHGLHGALSIPDVDVLIHAGHLTSHGELNELLVMSDNKTCGRAGV
jgi:predicted phosphodiesterase